MEMAVRKWEKAANKVKMSDTVEKKSEQEHDETSVSTYHIFQHKMS